MSYTRSQLRDLCRRRLGDLAPPYQFSDLQVNQWINDATDNYSLHFPARKSAVIDCLVGQHSYDLPLDFHAALSVEYPAGEDPPRTLAFSDRSARDFFATDGLYAVEISNQADVASQLWISADLLSTQDIFVVYQGDQAYLDDDDDACSVADRHLELILLYVRWAAFQELALTESGDPDPTSLALGTLELNAGRAQRAYLAALRKAQAAEAQSGRANWKMDRSDRVY